MRAQLAQERWSDDALVDHACSASDLDRAEDLGRWCARIIDHLCERRLVLGGIHAPVRTEELEDVAVTPGEDLCSATFSYGSTEFAVVHALAISLGYWLHGDCLVDAGARNVSAVQGWALARYGRRNSSNASTKETAGPPRYSCRRISCIADSTAASAASISSAVMP